MSSLRILQLSDTHLRGDHGPNAEGVDPEATFTAALDALADIGEIDLIVLGGDLSDDGSPASYQRLRELVTGFAGRHGADGSTAPVAWVPGNHDRRPGFRAVLGPGLSEQPAPPSGEDQRPVYDCRTVNGFRVVTLDSSVPGRTHGLVDEEQLDWLAGILGTDAGAGTLIVVHHPPVAPVTPLHRGIGLLDTDRLVRLLAHSDVRLVLSGHYHHELVDSIPGRDGRIPVVVSAGIVNHNQVLAPPGQERATAASGAMLIEIDADPASRGAGSDSGAHVRVIPLALGPEAELSRLDPEQVAAVARRIDASPEERRAAQR